MRGYCIEGGGRKKESRMQERKNKISHKLIKHWIQSDEAEKKCKKLEKRLKRKGSQHKR